MRQVEVECLPLDIPEAIEVDVTRARDPRRDAHFDAAVPGNVRPIFDTDYAVVTVLPPTVAEAAARSAAEAAPVEGAEAAEGAAGARRPPPRRAPRKAPRRAEAEGGKKSKRGGKKG